MNKLEEAITAFINAGGKAAFRERTDPLLFEQFAESIQLVVPEKLKAFLAKYEWLSTGPDETMTLGQIAAALEYIRDSRRDIPKNYLPIMDDQCGGYYYVVCQRLGKQMPSDFGVVMLNPGSHPRELEFKDSDFESFLISQLEWAKDLL